MRKITGNDPINPLNTASGALLGEADEPYLQGAFIYRGMTLRQYYAGLAMNGLLANNTYHNPNEKHKMITVGALAETAVTYADALIEALNKTT